MSPESKRPEVPQVPEFSLEYISADDFFEQVAAKLEELGVAERLGVPHGQLLTSGYDAAHPGSTLPRAEMWALTLDRVAENLATSVDTPFSYIEDAEDPVIAIYDPRHFDLTPTDAEGTHWRHIEDKPVTSALLAIFRPQE